MSLSLISETGFYFVINCRLAPPMMKYEIPAYVDEAVSNVIVIDAVT